MFLVRADRQHPLKAFSLPGEVKSVVEFGLGSGSQNLLSGDVNFLIFICENCVENGICWMKLAEKYLAPLSDSPSRHRVSDPALGVYGPIVLGLH